MDDYLLVVIVMGSFGLGGLAGFMLTAAAYEILGGLGDQHAIGEGGE